MTTNPNPFADHPQPPGAVRSQATGDPQNPYASPTDVAEEQAEPAIGIWRDGEWLVIHEWVASLPNRCVFTNELLTVRCRQQLSWSYPIDWQSRHVVLNFGVVETIHQQMVRRRNRWLLAGGICLAVMLLVLALALITAALGFFAYSAAVTLGTVMFSLLAAGLLFQRASICGNVFKIHTFKGPYFWLTGAGKPFLDSLPNWPG